VNAAPVDSRGGVRLTGRWWCWRSLLTTVVSGWYARVGYRRTMVRMWTVLLSTVEHH